MNKYIYFEDVPDIGSLFMEQILFSFESIPIVFVCTDKNNFRYLCVCDDVIDEESWIIVRIDNDRLFKILNDDATVLSAFVNKKVIIVSKGWNQGARYELTEYNHINRDELPARDQYLEMKKYLRAYMERIEHEISCSNLKLPLSCSDMPDDTEVLDVVISAREILKSEPYDYAFEDYDMGNILNGCSGNSIVIESVRRETDNEMTLSLAYAA